MPRDNRWPIASHFWQIPPNIFQAAQNSIHTVFLLGAAVFLFCLGEKNLYWSKRRQRFFFGQKGYKKFFWPKWIEKGFLAKKCFWPKRIQKGETRTRRRALTKLMSSPFLIQLFFRSGKQLKEAKDQCGSIPPAGVIVNLVKCKKEDICTNVSPKVIWSKLFQIIRTFNLQKGLSTKLGWI